MANTVGGGGGGNEMHFSFLLPTLAHLIQYLRLHMSVIVVQLSCPCESVYCGLLYMST